MSAEHFKHVVIALVDNARNFLINILLRSFRIFTDKFRTVRTVAFSCLSERHILKARTHTVISNHFADSISCALNVVCRTGRNFIKDNLLGGASSKHNVNITKQFFLAGKERIVLRKLHRIAECAHSARNNRNFMDRVCRRSKSSCKGVTSFVIRYNAALVFPDYAALFLKSDHHFFNGFVKIRHRNFLTSAPDGKQRRFVYDIRKIRAGKSCRRVSYRPEINI